MKYPEHISHFWRVREIDSSLTNVDFALYSFLCNKLNSAYWTTDRLTQRRDLICGPLGINPRQLEESRNRLKQKGFIDFITQTATNKAGKKQGVKGSSTIYIILNTDGFSVPNSVPIDTLSGREVEHYSGAKRTLSGTDILNINRKKNEDVERGFSYYIGEEGFDSMPDYLDQKYSITLERFKRVYAEPVYSNALNDFLSRNLQKTWKDEEDFRKHLNNSFKLFEEKNGEKLRKQASKKVTQSLSDLQITSNGRHH